MNPHRAAWTNLERIGPITNSHLTDITATVYARITPFYECLVEVRAASGKLRIPFNLGNSGAPDNAEIIQMVHDYLNAVEEE